MPWNVFEQTKYKIDRKKKNENENGKISPFIIESQFSFIFEEKKSLEDMMMEQ